MKRFLALTLIVGTLHAEEPLKHKRFLASLGAMVSGSLADAASSFGPGKETNPIYARGGQFTGSSLSLKLGITAGIVAAEIVVLHKHPKAERSFVIANYAMGATWGAVAACNLEAK